MKINLDIPSKAIDVIQGQLDQHNASTGAQLKLLPYLTRLVLVHAAQAEFASRLPELERQRDLAFQEATCAAQEGIIDTFSAPSQ